jgi:hypothetical protein
VVVVWLALDVSLCDCRVGDLTQTPTVERANSPATDCQSVRSDYGFGVTAAGIDRSELTPQKTGRRQCEPSGGCLGWRAGGDVPGIAMPRPSRLAGESLAFPEPEPEPEPELGDEPELQGVPCWKGCYHGTKLLLHVLGSAVTSLAAAALIGSCVDPDFVLALVAERFETDVVLRAPLLGAARAAALQLLHFRPNSTFVAWARDFSHRLSLALSGIASKVLLWIKGPAPSPPPSTCALMGLHDSPSRSHWTRGCAVECPRAGIAVADPAATGEPLPSLTEWEALTGCLSVLLMLLLTASAVQLLASLRRCVHSNYCNLAATVLMEFSA